MSFLTGTNTELISSDGNASGTPLTNTTLGTPINNGSGAAYLPIGFFYANAVGKKLRVVADGLISTSSLTTSAVQIGVALDTVLGTFNTGWATGQINATSAWTNFQWHLDVELVVKSLTEASGSSTGTTANVVGLGVLTIGGAIAATTPATVFIVGTTVANSYAINQAYFVEVYAKWNSANTNNTVTCYNVSVYGCN